jgi:hypothetical protein
MGSPGQPLSDQALAIADGDDLLALERDEKETPHLLAWPAGALLRKLPIVGSSRLGPTADFATSTPARVSSIRPLPWERSRALRDSNEPK